MGPAPSDAVGNAGGKLTVCTHVGRREPVARSCNQAHQRDAMEADLKELAGLRKRPLDEKRAALERAVAQLGGRAGRPARRLSQAGAAST